MARTKSAAASVQRMRKSQEAATLLKQVFDPTRLQILLLLSKGIWNVGQLVEELGLSSQPAVSHHLALLRHGRLVEPTRHGRNNVYSLTERGEALVRAIADVTG